MTQSDLTTPKSSIRHILVVDDDERLRDLLQRYLTEQGFRVSVAADGKAMTELKRQTSVDLIVLDVMMPGEDGMSICRRLRSAGDKIPIILLTAKVEDSSRIMGLDLGADDYVAKPFNPRELLSRINAVLRRSQTQEHPAGPSRAPEVLMFGPYELSLSNRTLSCNGKKMDITTAEFAMLKVFARHPNEPLSRDRLMELARGREYEAFDRSLDVQISRLRKLIEPNPSKPIYIQTVWGVGYVFVPDGQH
ncbi:osmolarity response regulator transcription factor OmpR [Orrella daihaiensis]|uniref:Two-component system response regulator OmpR n=1 Tax=Orrella daihaiensis TaxID=2782176 RepID=A0ABY4ALB6_9BURK|nr:two-component system response regulator OmpR [Orrella daihaiensis]UOD51057.1 two-component system response regulator OmpR [Orrella daihaiensis]